MNKTSLEPSPREPPEQLAAPPFSMRRNNEGVELQSGVAIVVLAVGWGAWLVLMRLAVWSF